MKRNLRKLTLAKETLRSLHTSHLEEVAGGAGVSQGGTCFITCSPKNCLTGFPASCNLACTFGCPTGGG
jgi:hypothetical protein